MWSGEEHNGKGRWAGKEITEENSQEALNADNGLIRERLKVCGTAALLSVIAGADLRETHDALIHLRNTWLTEGFEDRREVAETVSVHKTELGHRKGGPHTAKSNG